MSCRSFGQEKSSFTPYQQDMNQKQISLFSRLNLNEKDQISLEGPVRNQLEYEQSDLFSMRSRKRKGSVQIQLKQSLPGNRTYLNMSLVGKSSLRHHQLFGIDHEQDLGMGFNEEDDKKQLSQKSCPVGASSYLFQQNSFDMRIKEDNKPKFHKTKNLLRTVSSYFHKHLLYNKRSQRLQIKYFQRFLEKRLKQNLTTNQKQVKVRITTKGLKIRNDYSDLVDVKIQQISDEEGPNINLNIQQQVKGLNINQNQRQKQKQEKVKTYKIEGLNTQDEKNHTQKLKQPNNPDVCIQQKQNNRMSSSSSQTKTKTKASKQEIIQQIKNFHSWISGLSIVNFVDFQKVWTTPHRYLSIYRQLCYKYYKQQLYCEIMRSRLTVKDVSNKCMWQFIEGLFNPKGFYRFK